MGNSKDYRKALKRWQKQARKQGWTTGVTGGDHVFFTPPDSKLRIICAMTSSDYRAIKNARADLRRAGLAVD